VWMWCRSRGRRSTRTAADRETRERSPRSRQLPHARTVPCSRPAPTRGPKESLCGGEKCCWARSLVGRGAPGPALSPTEGLQGPAPPEITGSLSPAHLDQLIAPKCLVQRGVDHAVVVFHQGDAGTVGVEELDVGQSAVGIGLVDPGNDSHSFSRE